MKKFLIVFFVLFFTLVGLSACKLWPEKSSDNGNQIPDLPSEFEDINLKVYSDEKGVITWSYSGELHCEVLMEIFYGGELGVDPDTPVNKIRESLENIQAISFSVEEKRFNPAEQEFWSDLSSGIYTVALEFFLEKHLTYVFAFEKEEITDFLIEFIDGRSEKIIYSFEF